MPDCSNLSAMRMVIGWAGRVGGLGRAGGGNRSGVNRLTRPRPTYLDLPDLHLNQMRQQAVAQFGFEPGGLRRHDAAGVGDRHQVGQRDREAARTRRRTGANRRAVRAPATPRMPPTNSIRLSVRTSAMPRSGARMRSCSTLTSSVSAGGAARRVELQAVPAAVEIHRRLALARRRRRSAHRTTCATVLICSQERRRRLPFRSRTTRLYGKDLHLVVGERDREHVIVLAAAAAFERAPRARGAGGAVMAVGDVERRDRRERLDDRRVRGRIDWSRSRGGCRRARRSRRAAAPRSSRSTMSSIGR